MTLYEWLLANKPANTPFFIKRNFDPGVTVDAVETQMNLMAKLILDSVKFHTDNNFISDPLPDIVVQFGNVHLFDYKNCHFGLATNGHEMAVGAMFHMVKK